MSINLYHGDCLEAMKEMPDNAYDLAIVDPPYGIGADKQRGDTGKNKHIKQKDYHFGDWDSSIPSKEYFQELQRVSKNQIIWGGNYFLDYLLATNCFIVWDKVNGENRYADCELAWASFKTAVRKFTWRWHGFLQQGEKEQRIHPTQKPVKLYEWLLDNYAEPNQRILDTHLGSGSIALACHNRGFSLDAWEIDAEYHANAVKRFNQHKAQLTIF